MSELRERNNKTKTDRSDSVFGEIDTALTKMPQAGSIPKPAMTTSLYSISSSSPERSFPVNATKTIAATLAACMLNVIFLEYIIKSDPAAGTLVTFSQFSFVSLTGAITWWQFGKNTNQVPMKYHILTVILFWSVNFCNNLAFKYSIPMTLHTIFRSGSLVTNMLLGMLLAGKRYPFSKYLSVFFISLGIFICTLVSANQKEDKDSEKETEEGTGLILGIILLCYALVVSSIMGLIQEFTYKKYGKHPNEALFIDHVLGLPMFYFFSESISESFQKLLSSEPNTLLSSSLNINIPTGILFLIINVLTSYGCIKSVFILTTECTSLTVTLVITVRKFLTLMVSVFYFGNDFSFLHWVGTAMVFVGALVYADVIKLGGSNKDKDEQKKVK